MKKSFTISCLIYLSLGASINAQEVVKVIDPVSPLNVVELGVRFMPTFSSFNMKTSSSGTVKGEATLGYGVGALLGINFTNHIGIQGEIIYNSLSQKYVDQNLEREIKVSYVNVPLLLSLNTGKSDRVNLNVVFGPQFGINVGSSISGSTGALSDSLQSVIAIKKVDFGFAYGAGLEFALNPLKTIHLDFGFRGVYGFVNVSNTSAAVPNKSYYAIDNATVKTYSGYLGITFLF
jgi:opacity protein-like surface antigen